MDIFRTLGSRSLSVTAMLNFLGKAKISIHGLGEEDTSKFVPGHAARKEPETNNVRVTSKTTPRDLRQGAVVLEETREHWCAVMAGAGAPPELTRLRMRPRRRNPHSCRTWCERGTTSYSNDQGMPGEVLPRGDSQHSKMSLTDTLLLSL